LVGTVADVPGRIGETISIKVATAVITIIITTDDDAIIIIIIMHVVTVVETIT